MQPFLKLVIFKVHFAQPEPVPFDEKASQKFITRIKKAFPDIQSRQGFTAKFTFSKDTPQYMATPIKSWLCHDMEKTKTLGLAADGLSIEYRGADTFERQRKGYIEVLDAFVGLFPKIEIGRLGMRYINEIELKGKPFAGWRRYVHSSLLSGFRFPQDEKVFSRAYSNLTFNYGEFSVQFQYGMPNPDFPAPITKKIFTLDYDAFHQGTLTRDEVVKLLPKFHDRILDLFRSSVKKAALDMAGIRI
jgi:uncharacterized protein (TIGR04255 family)